MVNAIENECHAIPKGAVKLTPLNEIRPNEAFNGLNQDEALDLGNFVHFTQEKSEDSKCERHDSVFNANFLDPISNDSVKGSWSLHKDVTGGWVNIRNHVWSGYSCTHKAGTQTFTSFDYGDGLRNNDLQFMI